MAILTSIVFSAGSFGPAQAALSAVNTPYRASTASGCAKVVLYGLAGSGEQITPSGVGSTVAAVAKNLNTDLSGTVKVPVVPVAYPATTVFNAIVNGAFNGVNYPTSRAEGVTALQDLLTHQLQACPSAKIVLAGYSQGADVIGTYLDNAPPANVVNRIAGVALLGDPRFNPGDKAVDAGSFNPQYGPIFGRFGITPPWTHPPGTRPLFTAPLSTRTISVCNKGDPVCGYSWSNALGCFGLDGWKTLYASILAHAPIPIPSLRTSCAHLHYLDQGGTTITPGATVTATAVAAFLAAKVRAELPQAKWTATTAPLPPNGTDPVLSSLACSSTTSCVAVGGYGDAPSAHDALLLTGSGNAWSATEAPLPPDADGFSSSLTSVTCPGAAACVAVGSYSTQPLGVVRGLLLTGSGTSWTTFKVPLPANAGSGDSSLQAVACSTGTSCVAIGTYTDSSGNPQGLLVTGSGGSWTAAEAPLPPDAATNSGVAFQSIACPSATSCTAVGQYDDSSRERHGLLETGFGTSWTTAEAPLPPNVLSIDMLQAIACPSTRACVVTGLDWDSSDHLQALLLTGSGTTWTALNEPAAVTGATANGGSVACPSASSCVIADEWGLPSGAGGGNLVTGSGTTWTAIQAPAPGPSGNAGLQAIACPSTTLCVAGGYDHAQGLLVTGSGTAWTGFNSPVPADASSGSDYDLQFVACPTTNYCVAAGSYVDSVGGQHLLLATGPA